MSPIRATAAAIDAVWRIESARLIAGLTRTVDDVEIAEDLAQDALVAALEQWPKDGVPENAGAWLMTVAKRRGIDSLRRREALGRKLEELGTHLEVQRKLESPGIEESAGGIEDDTLRLLFMTCHPALEANARVALTLRLVGGLTTPEIAAAFLTPEGTIAQRIVRAKRTIKEARIAFDAPGVDELHPRLGSVLDVIYLVFNKGYAASSGNCWTNPRACLEALRLGRMVAALLPTQSEVHGLLALMEIQASRLRARSGPNGGIVLLENQDRGRWDRLLIRRGLDSLQRARELGGGARPFALQAAIAATHAEADSFEGTDWMRIVALYDALVALTGSAVVEINRAVAVSYAFGPEEALELVDELIQSRRLERYHLLASVRGDLLARLGRQAEARPEFLHAAELCGNEPERQLLLDRAAVGCEATSKRHAARHQMTPVSRTDGQAGR